MRVAFLLLLLLIIGSGLFWNPVVAETEATGLTVHVGIGEDPPEGAVIQLLTPDRSRVISEWAYEMGGRDEVFYTILSPGQYTLQSRPILAVTPAGNVVHPQQYNQDLDADQCAGTIAVHVNLTYGQARMNGVPECQSNAIPSAPSLKPSQGSLETPGGEIPYGTMVLGAAGLVSVWGAWRVRKRLIPLPLWARRASPRNGESARTRILDVIRQNPGIARESLRKTLGMAEGHLQHHLKVLAADGRVAEVRRARMRCFFIPGTIPPEQAVRLAVLARPGAKKVHEAVQRCPGASMSEIAKAAELSPSRVSRLIARLEDDGLLITRWTSGRRRLYPKNL